MENKQFDSEALLKKLFDPDRKFPDYNNKKRSKHD